MKPAESTYPTLVYPSMWYTSSSAPSVPTEATWVKLDKNFTRMIAEKDKGQRHLNTNEKNVIHRKKNTP